MKSDYSSHRLDRALEAATRYRDLVLDGRLEEADQIESTIDDLVGQWRGVRFVWPPEVAQSAGVAVLRRIRRLAAVGGRQAV